MESEEDEAPDKHRRHNEYEDSFAGDKTYERMLLFSRAYEKCVATRNVR